MIIVEASRDLMGNIEVEPVRADIRKKLIGHLADFGVESSGTALFQDGGPATEFIENDVPTRHRRDLDIGYTVRFKADPWIVGHWFGWDCHLVI